MSLVKEIGNKGVTVAWSPLASRPHLLAYGSKEGGAGGFDDYGGLLEVSSLNLESRDRSMPTVGAVKTTTRFSSLAWGEVTNHKGPHPLGLLAGGMTDGVVNLWDAAKVVGESGDGASEGGAGPAGAADGEAAADTLVARIEAHKAPVTALQFNPHAGARHMFASGAANHDVGIFSLERPTAARMPPLQWGTPDDSEITSVAWNTEVKHILGTAAASGTVAVWDLRTCKPWTQLRDPARQRFSAISWNPDDGLFLVTASDDDARPCLRLWDLRANTQTPLAELVQHGAGILSISWCPHDSSLLVSSGKDNKTLLWDITQGRAVHEIEAEPAAGQTGFQQANDFYGGTLGGSGSRRYEVQWSPHVRGVLATCSFDRKVQIFGLSGAAAGTARPPRWLRRPVGAAHGFGGTLATFGFPGASTPVKPGQAPPRHTTGVSVSRVPVDEALLSRARAFAADVDSGNFRDLCDAKAREAATARSRREWTFLRIMFDAEARVQLLNHLGYDAEAVAADAASFVKQRGGLGPVGDDGDSAAAAADAASESAAAMFGDASEPETKGDDSAPPTSPSSPGAGAPAGASAADDSETEEILRRALLVADYDSAVDCCLATNRLADALLFASNGSAELWARTMSAYFARRKSPLMRITARVMKGELAAYVAEAPLEQWEQTLAVATRYGSPDEYKGLCNALGDRLANEARDAHAATLCYLSAVNVEAAVGHWVRQAQAAAPIVGLGAALQELVEKVTMMRKAEEVGRGDGAAAPEDADHPEAEMIGLYAGLLASHGELDLARRFASQSGGAAAPGAVGSVGAVLTDRLVRAANAPEASSTAFPFEQLFVNPSPEACDRLYGIDPAITAAADARAAAKAQAEAEAAAQAQAEAQAAAAAAAQQAHAEAMAAQAAQAAQASAAAAAAATAPVASSAPAAPAAAAAPAQPVGWSPAAAATTSAATTTQPVGWAPPAVSSSSAGASRYGARTFTSTALPTDGFVSSVGNPSIGAKYGNEFTGAHTGPSAAAAAAAAAAEPAPKVERALTAAENEIIGALKSVLTHMSAVELKAQDKKKLKEGQECVAVLEKRMARSELSEEVTTSLTALTQACAAYDFRAAVGMQTELAAHEWTTHRDWLKGLKFMLQLAVKMQG